MVDTGEEQELESTEGSYVSGSEELEHIADGIGEDVTSTNNQQSTQRGRLQKGSGKDRLVEGEHFTSSGEQEVETDGGDGMSRELILTAEIFRDNTLSEGGSMKVAGNVVRKREENSTRNANMNCRVDAFGRMVEGFDGRKKKWVIEMGFGGLLHLAFKQLPRTLCYWLVTRVDPINEMFIAPDGREFRLSKNQVEWVMGIRSGTKPVPKKAMNQEMEKKMNDVENRYGKEWESVAPSNRRVIRRKGIPIVSALIERVSGEWLEEEEEDFKTMFLITALHMVLCPTQSVILASDLLPALTCAMNAPDYDWSALVIEKLMVSVRAFSKRFYADGYASGCGGCSIFLAVFYLDRLKRNPVHWGIGPRIRVWTTTEMRRACKEDRYGRRGDFGKLGVLDVAYGEDHPREARDIKPAWLYDGSDEVTDNTQRVRARPKRVEANFIVQRKRAKAAREAEIAESRATILP